MMEICTILLLCMCTHSSMLRFSHHFPKYMGIHMALSKHLALSISLKLLLLCKKCKFNCRACYK
ncbi:hypothetical protein RhiirA5_2273 [Rhizophagus irregularis]|uniref:Uncharacterized protein n=1 Tax=Rhizophagus irregularis TaxID=588596 RepID=A0A2N0PCE5_9GLOM|nr:hypothetical protein RhiirA5_2273 [Rhizophagus irregularis]